MLFKGRMLVYLNIMYLILKEKKRVQASVRGLIRTDMQTGNFKKIPQVVKLMSDSKCGPRSYFSMYIERHVEFNMLQKVLDHYKLT